MRIESLHIENYRRFRAVDLELPDGVTALVGRNGAGKSTLLEAVGWCLYGMDAARTEKDLIKRRGAAPSDDVRVRVAFHLGPHAYEVTRELLGKTGSHVATVLVDGKVVVPAGPQSAKESVTYLERALHMDAQGFFTSLVARQRELAALSEAKPAERRKILIGLLRLDAVDLAIGEARQRRRDARVRLDVLRAQRQDAAALATALEAARAGVGLAQAQLTASAVRVAALTDEVEDVRAQRESSRKLFDAYRQTSHTLHLARERQGLLAKDRERRASELVLAREAAAQAALLAPGLAALPEAKALCDRLAGLRHQALEAERVAKEVAAADAEAAKARAEVAAISAALAEGAQLRALFETTAAQRALLDEGLRAALQWVAEHKAKVSELEKAAQQAAARHAALRKLGPETPCPTCSRPLHEHHAALVQGTLHETESHRTALAGSRAAHEAARTAEKERRAALAELDARLDDLRTRVARHDHQGALLTLHQRRAAEEATRAARLREQHAALVAEPFDERVFVEARRALAALEADRERHARFAVLAAREPEVATLVADLDAQSAQARAAEADAASALLALAFDPAAHDALEQAAARAEGALAEARVARERLMGEQARRADEERRLVAEVARQAALAADIKAGEADTALLERLCGDDGLLVRFKDHLVGRIRPMLSAHAGRLFRELTDGRYADLEVAEDYDLLVHDDGQAYALGRFSGGESDLANLCLRLAVSQVVAERAGGEGFNFLALDEVFGSQDETRKANILRALRGLSARFRQIVLITHIDDVKEAAENVLRVEALDDGTSRVIAESTA